MERRQRYYGYAAQIIQMRLCEVIIINLLSVKEISDNNFA